MKIPLLLAIFLSFGVAEIAESHERSNCIREVNEWRKKLANDGNISNMNRLTYDDELQAKADKVISAENCNYKSKKTADFDSIRFEKSGNTVDEFLKNPGRSKFACIRKTCTGPQQSLIWVTDLGSSPPIPGPAGSNCPSGMKNEDSLCYFPIKLTTSKPEIPTKKVEETSGATSSEIVILAVLIAVFWGIL